MRTVLTITGLIVVLAASTTLAPGQGTPNATSSVWGPQSAPPTRVREFSLYQCPSHPEIQATWPAQCPACGTALQGVAPRSIAVGIVPAAGTNYPDEFADNPAPMPPDQFYPGPGYYPAPQSTQYNTQYAYPPSTQYSYPPSGPYGTQGYPPSTQYGQTYPPSTQYGQTYPPSMQYAYPPNTQYAYPPTTQYPPGTQYGQTYPPGTQYAYPPSSQYAYPPGTPAYPPYNPNYGYAPGYPYYPNQTEPNNPYGDILQDLNRLFHR